MFGKFKRILNYNTNKTVYNKQVMKEDLPKKYIKDLKHLAGQKARNLQLV